MTSRHIIEEEYVRSLEAFEETFAMLQGYTAAALRGLAEAVARLQGNEVRS